jgi:hypothetical protein
MTYVIYSISPIAPTVIKPESNAWIRANSICEGENVLGVIPRLPNEQDRTWTF